MYTPNDLAIYIHWPFCKSKCPYCDFYSVVNPSIDQDVLVKEYIEALLKYYDLTSERYVKSIFFGGGTPSLIKPKNVAKIIDFICSKWKNYDNIEISLEANPNSRYNSIFSDFKNAGINRLSLGVQALNEDDLHFFGRTHNLATARLCLEEIVKTFDNHSADLIYARPHQNMNEWQKELCEICGYGLKHISLYQLTIEENTVFARKGIHPLEDDEAVQMYNFTRQFLADHCYKHYEVSNFAQNDYESRHNMTYWQGGDYLGIGKTAHGRLYLNNQHIATEYPFIHTPITADERAEELLLMGLRLTQGINKANFKKICGINLDSFINQNKAQQLREMNLLEESADFLRVSYDGMLFLDEIIRELCYK